MRILLVLCRLEICLLLTKGPVKKAVMGGIEAVVRFCWVS